MSLTRADDRAEGLSIALSESQIALSEAQARIAHLERGLTGVIAHVHTLRTRAHHAALAAPITHEQRPTEAGDLDDILARLAGVLAPLPTPRSKR